MTTKTGGETLLEREMSWRALELDCWKLSNQRDLWLGTYLWQVFKLHNVGPVFLLYPPKICKCKLFDFGKTSKIIYCFLYAGLELGIWNSKCQSLNSKSSNFKGETQRYEVKLPNSAGTKQ